MILATDNPSLIDLDFLRLSSVSGFAPSESSREQRRKPVLSSAISVLSGAVVALRSFDCVSFIVWFCLFTAFLTLRGFRIDVIPKVPSSLSV